jgi:hypothetical protein
LSSWFEAIFFGRWFVGAMATESDGSNLFATMFVTILAFVVHDVDVVAALGSEA